MALVNIENLSAILETQSSQRYENEESKADQAQKNIRHNRERPIIPSQNQDIYEESSLANLENAIILHAVLTDCNQQQYKTQDQNTYSGAELKAITSLILDLNPHNNSEESKLMTQYAESHFNFKHSFRSQLPRTLDPESEHYISFKYSMTNIQNQILNGTIENNHSYSKQDIANWVKENCSSPNQEISQISAQALQINQHHRS